MYAISPLRMSRRTVTTEQSMRSAAPASPIQILSPQPLKARYGELFSLSEPWRVPFVCRARREALTFPVDRAQRCGHSVFERSDRSSLGTLDYVAVNPQRQLAFRWPKIAETVRMSVPARTSIVAAV